MRCGRKQGRASRITAGSFLSLIVIKPQKKSEFLSSSNIVADSL